MAETNFTLGPTSKTNKFPLLFLVIVVLINCRRKNVLRRLRENLQKQRREKVCRRDKPPLDPNEYGEA